MERLGIHRIELTAEDRLPLYNQPESKYDGTQTKRVGISSGMVAHRPERRLTLAEATSLRAPTGRLSFGDSTLAEWQFPEDENRSGKRRMNGVSDPCCRTTAGRLGSCCLQMRADR